MSPQWLILSPPAGCLPQLFARKYARAAELYNDAVFLEIFGDETPETRVRRSCCAFCLSAPTACTALCFLCPGCARGRAVAQRAGNPGPPSGRSPQAAGLGQLGSAPTAAPPARCLLSAGAHASVPLPHRLLTRPPPALCLLPQKLMISMKVKVTPTFVLYRGTEQVHSHGGVNENNFHKAIQVRGWALWCL